MGCKKKLGVMAFEVFGVICVSHLFAESPVKLESLQPKKWAAESRLHLKAGNVRKLGQAGLTIPIVQDQDSLWFFDVRSMADSKNNKEGNLGLAFRKLKASSGWILGGYGFYDIRKSEHHNTFNQFTLGLEALSETWDYRLNTYTPLSKSRPIKSSRSPERIFRGHNEYFTERKEIPLGGFDLEIGRSVPKFDRLRLYAAGYYFYGSGAIPVKGVRGRAEIRVNDYLSFTGSQQYDNIRHGAIFVGVLIHVPFGRRADREKLTPLERRMTHEIERDVDIVAQASKPKLVSTEDLYIFAQKRKSGREGSFETPTSSTETTELIEVLEKNPNYFYYDLDTGERILAREKLSQLKATYVPRPPYFEAAAPHQNLASEIPFESTPSWKPLETIDLKMSEVSRERLKEQTKYSVVEVQKENHAIEQENNLLSPVLESQFADNSISDIKLSEIPGLPQDIIFSSQDQEEIETAHSPLLERKKETPIITSQDSVRDFNDIDFENAANSLSPSFDQESDVHQSFLGIESTQSIITDRTNTPIETQRAPVNTTPQIVQTPIPSTTPLNQTPQNTGMISQPSTPLRSTLLMPQPVQMSSQTTALNQPSTPHMVSLNSTPQISTPVVNTVLPVNGQTNSTPLSFPIISTQTEYPDWDLSSFFDNALVTTTPLNQTPQNTGVISQPSTPLQSTLLMPQPVQMSSQTTALNQPSTPHMVSLNSTPQISTPVVNTALPVNGQANSTPSNQTSQSTGMISQPLTPHMVSLNSTPQISTPVVNTALPVNGQANSTPSNQTSQSTGMISQPSTPHAVSLNSTPQISTPVVNTVLPVNGQTNSTPLSFPIISTQTEYPDWDLSSFFDDALVTTTPLNQTSQNTGVISQPSTPLQSTLLMPQPVQMSSQTTALNQPSTPHRVSLNSTSQMSTPVVNTGLSVNVQTNSTPLSFPIISTQTEYPDWDLSSFFDDALVTTTPLNQTSQNTGVISQPSTPHAVSLNSTPQISTPVVNTALPVNVQTNSTPISFPITSTQTEYPDWDLSSFFDNALVTTTPLNQTPQNTGMISQPSTLHAVSLNSTPQMPTPVVNTTPQIVQTSALSQTTSLNQTPNTLMDTGSKLDALIDENLVDINPAPKNLQSLPQAQLTASLESEEEEDLPWLFKNDEMNFIKTQSSVTPQSTPLKTTLKKDKGLLVDPEIFTFNFETPQKLVSQNEGIQIFKLYENLPINIEDESLLPGIQSVTHMTLPSLEDLESYDTFKEEFLSGQNAYLDLTHLSEEKAKDMAQFVKQEFPSVHILQREEGFDSPSILRGNNAFNSPDMHSSSFSSDSQINTSFDLFGNDAFPESP
ncbi:Inverse autotransporter beta-barrel domain-containing protein [Candidatus Bealeia paramacronuclearis]|uniref:Inverse autotransporter beta-barrel domain-containing protein n=1 Tax=Candidatus Bealeia paramacronuclearis TaxID=1921001 RepID=A0ABZ2C4G6_9PROT|nr:Inverse autotransporter beta-barrel domain-containing protein [Candidatus Bealeia paramacronuclearis]